MQSLAQEYIRLCDTPSDINEHLPVLKSLAEKYSHITEMGVRYGVSTIAFLAGHPKTLVSYDIKRQINVSDFQRIAPSTQFIFHEHDTLTTDIAPTDVLFIDTLHNELQLRRELDRHAPMVRKHIVLHDTVTFGDRGEDGGPGLNAAISYFLGLRLGWRMSEFYANNNGLTILFH